MSVRLLGVVAAMAAMGLVACGDDTGGAGGSGGSGSGGATATTGTGTVTGTGGGATVTGSGGGATTTTTTTSTSTATGTGGGGSTAPCAEACADDAGCDESPANPDGACSECVQAEADKGTASECAVEGALGPCCQDDPECAEYVTCVLTGGETCGDDFPAGGARASECVLNSCGDCGTPG